MSALYFEDDQLFYCDNCYRESPNFGTNDGAEALTHICEQHTTEVLDHFWQCSYGHQECGFFSNEQDLQAHVIAKHIPQAMIQAPPRLEDLDVPLEQDIFENESDEDELDLDVDSETYIEPQQETEQYWDAVPPCGWIVNGVPCELQFDTPEELQAHCTNEHFVRRDYTCGWCGQKKNCKSTLESHLRSHTKEKPFSCQNLGCSYRTSVKGNVEIHENSCRWSTGTNIPTTKKRKPPARKLESRPIRTTTSTTKRSKTYRYQNQNGDDSSFGLFNFDSDSDENTTEQYWDEVPLCGWKVNGVPCGRQFNTPKKLQAHCMRCHYVKEENICGWCEQETNSKLSLGSHLRTHTKEKPFPCHHTNCEHRSAREGDRKKHEITCLWNPDNESPKKRKPPAQKLEPKAIRTKTTTKRPKTNRYENQSDDSESDEDTTEKHYWDEVPPCGWKVNGVPCGRQFNTPKKLQAHCMNEHFVRGNHTCGWCGKIKTTKQLLQKHLRMHTNEKPFICRHTDCLHRSAESINRDRHEATCKLNPDCDSTTKRHKTSQYKNQSDGSESDEDEYIDIETCTEQQETELYCDEVPPCGWKVNGVPCGLQFDTPEELQAHCMNKHHDKGNYTCGWCEKETTSNSSLEIHLRAHTKEKPFPCQNSGCSYRFTTKGNCDRHEELCEWNPDNKSPKKQNLPAQKLEPKAIRTKTTTTRPKTNRYENQSDDSESDENADEMPQCGWKMGDSPCGRKFNTPEELQAHCMRRHYVEGENTCGWCEQKTAAKLFLEGHLRTHTKEKPFSCRHANCEYRSAHERDCKRHESTCPRNPDNAAQSITEQNSSIQKPESRPIRSTAKRFKVGQYKDLGDDSSFTLSDSDSESDEYTPPTINNAKNTTKPSQDSTEAERYWDEVSPCGWKVNGVPCGCQFDTPEELQAHCMNEHRVIGNYICGWCGEERTELLRHMQTHTGEKPFPCQYANCKHRSTRKNAIASHEKICKWNPDNSGQ